ncbi:MAG TPA: class I SAM-dependent methyltransferase [Alphaproteobacteria bacterium]|jgi:SAM-dependent methyltransferase
MKQEDRMAESATDQGDIQRVDEVWGDPDNWAAEGWHWTHLPAIHRMNNRHVTGDPDLSALAWFFERVAREQSLPLDRALVLACGGGHLERLLRSSGWAREVVAIDLSPRSLATAEETAKAQGLTGIRYQIGDMNRLDVVGPFDAVFNVSASHHCSNLEGLFDVVKRVLKPGGWFFTDDFVGPSRFQWSDLQVLQINRLLQMLPDRFVHSRSGWCRRGFYRNDAKVVADFDPSEAVRSAEILPLLHRHFHVETCRGYGGGLLHLALANVAHTFDPEQTGDPTGPAYLDLLIEASDHLRRTGRTQDDFAVAIARHPKS